MMNFKQFLLEKKQSEEEKNVEQTLSRLPAHHRKLLQGFKFNFEAGNTLNGDDDHIGYIHKNKIAVAAPWHYGREWTFLHEVAHLIFEKYCSPEWKKKWSEVVKKNPKRQKQNDEELFCMAYANHFAKHKIDVHNHPDWEKYMTEFCKVTK